MTAPLVPDAQAGRAGNTAAGTDAYPPGYTAAERLSAPTEARGKAEDQSIGSLIAEVADDVSRLFRQEVELATAEIKQEATKAGKAAGMLGAAGFAGYMTVLLLSFAIVYALANVMDHGWAFLIVAVIWGIVGAVLFANGKKKAQNVSPMPNRTVETLKEDAKWLKNPTG